MNAWMHGWMNESTNSKECDRRVVLLLDAGMKANLARAIAKLVRQVVDALSVMFVCDVEIAVMLHRTVLPSSTRSTLYTQTSP